MAFPGLHTDDDLISLIKNSEQSGYVALYDKYAPALNGIILNIVGNDVETGNHILVSFFSWLWKNIHQFNHGRLFTWLVITARKFAIEFLELHKNAMDAITTDHNAAPCNDPVPYPIICHALAGNNSKKFLQNIKRR